MAMPVGGNGTCITIFASTKVLLRALNAAETTAELVDALLETARLLGQGDGLGGGDGTGFGFDHDVEVDELFGEGGHVVGEAEGVLSGEMGGEDVVPLTLALAFDDNGVGGVGNGPIDVERATRLHLERTVSAWRRGELRCELGVVAGEPLLIRPLRRGWGARERRDSRQSRSRPGDDEGV